MFFDITEQATLHRSNIAVELTSASEQCNTVLLYSFILVNGALGDKRMVTLRQPVYDDNASYFASRQH